MKGYLSETLHLLGDEKRKLPLMIVLFVIVSLLDLAGLGLIGPYIALVVNPLAYESGPWVEVFESLDVPRDRSSLLVILGLSLLGVFILKSLSAIWINRKIIYFSYNQKIRLSSHLMKAYQAMPYSEYTKRNSSEYIHTIHQLTGQFSNGVVLPALRSLSDGIVAFAILFALAYQDWIVLLLLGGLIGCLILGYDKLFRNRLKQYGEGSNEAATHMVRGIQEGIDGFKEIRILRKEKYFHRMVSEGTQKFAEFQARTQFIGIAPRYMLELLLVAFIVVLVLMTLFFSNDFNLLIPTIGMFGLASLRLLPMANVFINSMIQLRYSRDGVLRLYRDVTALDEMKAKQPSASNLTSCKRAFDRLTLNQVSFSYDSKSKVALKDVSLEIAKGESIGLIGPSGSGKTTLVDLMLGLLEPTKGELSYNGRKLKDVLPEWHSQVAYLPQEIFLIDDTLRQNVALGVEKEEIDEDRVIMALNQARIDDLLELLPNGAETLLGEHGVRLSGGQRQRVALARAFYHGRNILVLDEATSALDNQTETEIVDEIKHLRGDKTMIVIAHRLTTVRHCHRIYCLEKGEIVKVGNPDAMLSTTTEVKG